MQLITAPCSQVLPPWQVPRLSARRALLAKRSQRLVTTPAAFQQRRAAQRALVPCAAAADGSAAEASPQLSQLPGPKPDISNLHVMVEFVFTVQGRCTLKVHGQLEDPRQAATAATIAASLVNLRKRQRVLDAAVGTARRQLPGALDAPMLKRFDELVSQGRQGAGLELLGFRELHAICKCIAPDLCREVEQEIVEQAAELKARAMRPAAQPPTPNTTSYASSSAGSSGSGGTNTGGAGGSSSGATGDTGSSAGTAAATAGSGATPAPPRFVMRPGFDLPTELVRLPRWQDWVRRMRDAVVAWQLEQHRLERQCKQEQRQREEKHEQEGQLAEPQREQQGVQGVVQEGQQQMRQGAAAGVGTADNASSTEQPAGDKDSAPAAAPAAAASAPSQPAAKLGPAVTVTGAPPGSLIGSFISHSTTPDGLPMQHEVRIAVSPPGGTQLLSQLRQDPGWLRKQALVNPAVMSAAVAPEPQLQSVLEASAWTHVRLDPSGPFSFTCTLHGGSRGADAVVAKQEKAGGAKNEPQEAAAAVEPEAAEAVSADAAAAVLASADLATGSSAPDGSSSSEGIGSSDFEFEGSGFELRALAYSLGWILGAEQEDAASLSGVWVPTDGRIRLQRCSGDGGGSRGWLWRRRRQEVGRKAADSGSCYRLRVWPPVSQPAAGQGHEQGPATGSSMSSPSWQNNQVGKEARTAELSQHQLGALLDCLDGFAHQHPGFVLLAPPEPLYAPPPRLLQRLDSLFRGARGSTGNSDSSNTSSSSGNGVGGGIDPNKGDDGISSRSGSSGGTSDAKPEVAAGPIAAAGADAAGSAGTAAAGGSGGGATFV